MAVSRTLRRLLRVLSLQEEQSKLAIESALAELHRLEHALAATGEQARAGRRLVTSSVQTGELPDRLAGLEETRTAGRRSLALAFRVAAVQSEVDSLRHAFLARRIECRQVETLIREAEARDALDAGRRAQQGLDSWYLNRLHATAPTTSGPSSDPSKSPTAAFSRSEEIHTAKSKDLSENLTATAIDVLNREARSRF